MLGSVARCWVRAGTHLYCLRPRPENLRKSRRPLVAAHGDWGTPASTAEGRQEGGGLLRDPTAEGQGSTLFPHPESSRGGRGPGSQGSRVEVGSRGVLLGIVGCGGRGHSPLRRPGGGAPCEGPRYASWGLGFITLV